MLLESHYDLSYDDLPSAFDYALAESLIRRIGTHGLWLRDLIARLSAAAQQGHSCLPLHRLLITYDETAQHNAAVPKDIAQLHVQLRASGLVGDPGTALPLICDGMRLYLRRYFEYERRIAEDLVRRTCHPSPTFDAMKLRQKIDTLFPINAATTLDWQRVAAILALRQNLTLILGGPGSGKTWTVLRLLALIAQCASQPLRIALAAPTGKAAMRMTESLQRDLANLPVTESLCASLPREATTLHRLLGMRPHSSKPRYDSTCPLPLDVLVLDEASMIDLPTMARLLAALPTQARLILLGDPDQLASVEIGNVLFELRAFNLHNHYSSQTVAMITAASGNTPPSESNRANCFGDAVVTLAHSHRFLAGGSIAQLVEAIRIGDADTACSILRNSSGTAWHELEQDDAIEQTLQIAAQRYAPLQIASTPDEALSALASFRVLGALREGPWGMRALNMAIARMQLSLPRWQPVPLHYPKAPLLVIENNHTLRLYNGDSGVLLADEKGRLRAWFAHAQNGLRGLATTQLPAFELSYAMTVHKAQGSEYDGVLVLLPPQPHPLLTRQWLYTALSRARKELILIGSETVLRAAIATPAHRCSGLAEQIIGLLDNADLTEIISS